MSALPSSNSNGIHLAFLGLLILLLVLAGALGFHYASWEAAASIPSWLPYEAGPAGRPQAEATTVISGHIGLPGRPAPPHSSWAITVTTSLHSPGKITPLSMFTATTNHLGYFSFPADTVPGVYDLRVKAPNCLAKRSERVSLMSSPQTLDFGMVRSGDASGDNCVTILDFSQLRASFSVCQGQPGYDDRVNFNGDGCVTILDFSLLRGSFSCCGDDLVDIPTPTATQTAVAPTTTPSSTASATGTPTASGTPSPSQTATPLPSSTGTPTPSRTATVSPTTTQTMTATATATPTRTPTDMATPSSTPTPVPSHTPTGTATSSLTPTLTHTATATHTPTLTLTSTQMPTQTPTDTATPSSTATASPSETSTSTATATPTPTATLSPTSTATATRISSGPTTVCGPLASSEAWDEEHSPYLVTCDVVVDTDQSLALQAGTEVRFAAHTGLTVRGSLAASGTASQPVVFTADTDSPAPGYWRSIAVASAGQLTLDNAVIRFGGGDSVGNPTGRGVDSGGRITVTNSLLAQNGAYAVYSSSPAVLITSSQVLTHTSEGVHIAFAGGTVSPVVRDNTFSGNGTGVSLTYATPGEPLILENNQFNANSIAAEINGPLRAGPSISGNTASGNTAVNGLRLNGAVIVGAVTLTPDPGLPFALTGVTSLDVPEGSSLTLPAGTIFKLWRSNIVVNGTLQASGTALNPVVFTSLRDDAYGGDTDGTAAPPSAGDWQALLIGRDVEATVTLDHAVIRYGGGLADGTPSDAGGIQLSSGSATIANSAVAQNSGVGIYVMSGSCTVQYSNLSGHSTFGVKRTGFGPDADTRNNWWGSVTGPRHSSNPDGTGDAVSDGVSFRPWLTSAN